MKNKWVIINLVVFYGAIWGILEATLGYVLQFGPHVLSGMIMFPLAAGLLIALYLQTGSRRAMFAAGLVAAAIKSVNLLMPLMAWRTLTPMIAIIFESLMLASVVSLIVAKPLRRQATGFVAASLSWRALFLGAMAIRYAASGFMFSDLASAQTITAFIVYQGLAGAGVALLAYRGIRLWMTGRRFQFRPAPIMTAAVFALAIVATVVNTLLVLYL